MKISVVEALRSKLPKASQGVELRVFNLEHINKQYLGWLNDMQVVRFSNQRFMLHDEKTSIIYHNRLREAGGLLIAIHLCDNFQFVGTMSVTFSTPHKTADIGILLGERSCWGRGIGSAAWSCLLGLLLETGEVRKVTGGTLACNAAMIGIMKNSGMFPDGVRSKHEIVDGEPQDVLYFARFSNVF